MSTFLLDANALIALLTREHVHHERVSVWAADVDRFALCPIVQGAFLRFGIRLGVPIGELRTVLRLVAERRGFEFWPDSLSYADASLDQVRGHRQVTDAYLASLARSRPDVRLATLDEALAAAVPGATLLIPFVAQA